LFATYPSLADRVVLITGGGSGIGAELVRAFAGNGARVAFLDVEEDASASLVASLGDARHPPVFLPCDVRDIGALRAAVERVRRDLGPVAALVNNAARDDRHELDDVTPDSWDESIAVNLKHFFFAIQAARPHMRELGGGSIVNLSSIAWMRGAPRLSVYASAKAAIVGMTRSLAGELGVDGIRINAIAPGACVTERQLRLWYNETTLAAVIDRQCLKERLLPPDIARTALFLAADDSRMITKQTFVVDAGLL
jgi:NAD(P)-dependent dehydrogenase (short-subunit alcohol dehydrogenase family)